MTHQRYLELLRQPIITKASVKKLLSCSDSYAYTVLTRMKRRGLITQIQKGTYTALDDIHVIASNLYSPSYLCLWTASAYKGYTEQILTDIQVAVTTRHPPTTFQDYRIHPITYSPTLFFGFEKVRTGDHSLFISDDEKLLIDALAYQDHMGNPDEIIKAFENADISEERITAYLARIKNVSLTKRCGFLLHHIRGLDLSDEFDLSDRNYVTLFTGTKGKKTDATWRITHDF